MSLGGSASAALDNAVSSVYSNTSVADVILNPARTACQPRYPCHGKVLCGQSVIHRSRFLRRRLQPETTMRMLAIPAQLVSEWPTPLALLPLLTVRDLFNYTFCSGNSLSPQLELLSQTSVQLSTSLLQDKTSQAPGLAVPWYIST